MDKADLDRIPTEREECISFLATGLQMECDQKYSGEHAFHCKLTALREATSECRHREVMMILERIVSMLMIRS